MQSILNCLRVAIQNINDFNTEKKRIEITTPDVVNTIYRLIYLSNISISFQALSLLLQLVLVQNEKHDRFYNALYKKMTDLEIVSANNKITSLYFHIIHRSIHQDSNVPRAKAFIKRILQMALSFPPGKACGALIVISKLLRSRPELISMKFQDVVEKISDEDAKSKLNLAKFEESDDEEVYKDVTLDESGNEVKVETEKNAKSSWIHVQHVERQKIDAENEIKKPTKYDPFKRSAAYAGAELSLYYELVLMSKYFHPTVQVFVENIVKNHNIKYYGDPLKDFGLSHFLERFAFKNPKKVDPKEEKSAFKHQSYQPKGSRGQSVYLLTEQSCTEDERFIFDFIQRKREIREQKVKFSDEKERDSDVESIDDDEFDAYLDTLGAANDYEKGEKDFDYLSDMKDINDAPEGKSKKKKKSAGSDEESNDDQDEWDELNESGDENDEEMFEGGDGDESGTDQSIDEEIMADSDGSISEDDASDNEDMKPSKIKKVKMPKGGDNLFAAVEDFSEMIEQNASSTHGTLGEIFNKDKSAQKQLDWEQKRHNNITGFKRKKSFDKKKFSSTKKKRY
jgi:ribosome biogenesis protein MAK21